MRETKLLGPKERPANSARDMTFYGQCHCPQCFNLLTSESNGASLECKLGEVEMVDSEKEAESSKIRSDGSSWILPLQMM